MDNAEYHSHPAISKSHLDQIARSPLHYWARYVDPNCVPTEPTPAMRLGTAVHTHVLELSKWDEQIAVAPAIKRTTNAGKEQWAAFEAENAGKVVITRDDYDQVAAMGRSVHSHPAAAALLAMSGIAESTWMWLDETTGLQCKCRPDWLTTDGRYVIDLKTTEDASPQEFKRSIAKWRYHVQAAWYLDGIEKATGRRSEQFIFICVEKKAPYACAVYAADDQMIAMGAEAARRDLDTLAICKAAESWPGYSDQVESIGLPGWMLPRADGTLPAPTEIEMY